MKTDGRNALAGWQRFMHMAHSASPSPALPLKGRSAGRGWRWVAVLLLVMLGTTGARAAELRIRLVRTSFAEGPVPEELADVMPTLRASLVFKSYTLMDQTRTILPVNDRALMLGGYTIVCQGDPKEMRIVIRRGEHKVMETLATIKPGQPLLLGGFCGGGGGGQVVFIFTIH